MALVCTALPSPDADAVVDADAEAIPVGSDMDGPGVACGVVGRVGEEGASVQ